MKRITLSNKVYLSGKITGLASEEAQRIFAEAEHKLTEAGFTVINPYAIGLPDEHRWCELGIPERERWEKHIDRDLDLLRQCTWIYMLENWSTSTGAQIELKEAIALKLGIAGDISNEDVDFYAQNNENVQA